MKFEGLETLCNQIRLETSYKFTPESLIYFIRQVNIGDGCCNFCSHCFSNSPKIKNQMEIEGFEKLIKEIGYVLEITKEPLKFFHLGSVTDPAAISNYYLYLNSWMSFFPKWQTIKLFSHGWNLDNFESANEFHAVLQVVEKQKKEKFKFVFSFDEFSYSASLNWDNYVLNLCKNVQEVMKVMSKEMIRFEVLYKPFWNNCNSIYRLEYWKEEIKNKRINSFDDIYKQIPDPISEADKHCYKITTGLLSILNKAGFQIHEIPKTVLDYGSIYPVGRGINFYNDEIDIQKGLNKQELRVLQPLDNYRFGTKGLILNPNGSAEIIDYRGYKTDYLLNSGKKIVSYINSFSRG